MADHPIHNAVRHGNLTQVQKYITQDSSLLEIKNQHDYTPLMQAAHYGHDKLAEWLLNQGSNIQAIERQWNRTSLFIACEAGHGGVVVQLLKKGHRMHKSLPRTSSNLMLVTAIIKGHDHLVPILMNQMSVNLDAQDRCNGKTYLHHAVTFNRPLAMKQLLIAGADPRIADNIGKTPVGYARERQFGECIKLLEVSQVFFPFLGFAVPLLP